MIANFGSRLDRWENCTRPTFAIFSLQSVLSVLSCHCCVESRFLKRNVRTILQKMKRCSIVN